MDYLQQANRDLENQLKDTIDQHVEATRRANDLEGKNAELLLELKDINRLSKQVEEDKERDVSIVRSELVETKVWQYNDLPYFINIMVSIKLLLVVPIHFLSKMTYGEI